MSIFLSFLFIWIYATKLHTEPCRTCLASSYFEIIALLSKVFFYLDMMFLFYTLGYDESIPTMSFAIPTHKTLVAWHKYGSLSFYGIRARKQMSQVQLNTLPTVILPFKNFSFLNWEMKYGRKDRD